MTTPGPFRVRVSDLVGRPGAHREVAVTGELDIEMDLARVIGPVEATVRLDATSVEIVATGVVEFDAALTCHRCLTSFVDSGRSRFSQVYREGVGDDDEDLLPIVDGLIDLEPPIHDEVGLALPLTPLCRPDCAGLCPTCGTDLNTEPCEGHEELSSSPFAVLEHLLDPQE